MVSVTPELIKIQSVMGLGDLKKYFRKDESVSISRYLDERLVVFLEENTRDAVISRLVDVLDQAGKLIDKNRFFSAIVDREKLVSTGIGVGVAIPHAKIEGYEDFFIAIAVLKKRGVDWNSLDGSEVKVVFMIGGPENKQTEYLKILSKLTHAVKDEERRKKILKTSSAKEVIDLFQEC